MTPDALREAMNSMKQQGALAVLNAQLERCTTLMHWHTEQMIFQRRMTWISRCGGFCAVVGAVASVVQMPDSMGRAFVNGAVFMLNVWAFWSCVVKQEKRWHEVLAAQKELPELEATIQKLIAEIKEQRSGSN